MTHTVTIKTSATQWGVGHGGFHTQRVDFMISDHRLGCVNFVYDCGTLSSPRNLQPWITQFVKELEDARTRKLDAVTISHFGSRLASAASLSYPNSCEMPGFPSTA